MNCVVHVSPFQRFGPQDPSRSSRSFSSRIFGYCMILTSLLDPYQKIKRELEKKFGLSS